MVNLKYNCNKTVRGVSNGENLMPIVLGYEIEGEIVQIGNNVTTLEVEQGAVCKHIVRCGKCKNCLSGLSYMCQDGGFATYAVVPAINFINLPDDYLMR